MVDNLPVVPGLILAALAWGALFCQLVRESARKDSDRG